MTDEMMTVPEGHRLSVCSASHVPWINVLEGGALLAQLGTGGDDTDAELTAAMGRVGTLLREPRQRVLVGHASQLSLLMAPHDPEVTAVGALVVWTLDADRLAHAPKVVALVQRWLQYVRELGTSNDLAQAAYLIGANKSAFARGLVALLGGLGVEVRVPLRRDAAVLVEVVRPDGGVITSLAGSPFEVAPDPAAPLVIDHPETLTRKLAPGAPDKLAVLRAPRLRQLTLEALERGARQALYEELLRREEPLLLAVDAARGGPRGVGFADGTRALAVFGDELCLYASAAAYGWAGNSGVVLMTARKLFDWAASERHAFALHAELANDKRVHVLIPPDDSVLLARGKLPG